MRLDTSRYCPEHHPEHRVVRCQLARGHRPTDVHWAKLGDVEYRWGPGLEEAKPTSPPNGFVPTEHYLAAEIFTDGIKAAFIAEQLLNFGEVTCIQCRRLIVAMDADDHELGSTEWEEAFNKALAAAMSLSDKNHRDRRHGHGYRPKKYGNDFGHDSPILIEAPICRRCHTGPDSEIHPGPQLTKSSS